ncbi:FHA domain-containing protein [Roseateles sp.]|jgi:hypothetical protein|uniref:FHA domain-containing protein n=1 Tax=Roseateles sp. TaxID=1971397 RepID=UPI00391AD479
MDGSKAAVIEVLGRDGLVRAVYRVQAWPVSIGRSPACDLVLDDVHLAAEHARLELAQAACEPAEGDGSGRPRLSLLDSLNGGWLGRRRLAAGSSVELAPGAVFQLGATSLRLRRDQDTLPPERLLDRVVAPPAPGALLGLMGLWLALLGLDRWSGLNPGAPWVDYAAALLLPLALLLVWAALWALVTQLFQHRFPFALHLWRAVCVVTGLQLLGFVLPGLAYSFSARSLLALEALSLPVGLGLLLWWHAQLVWPRGRRALAWVGAGLLLGSMTLLAAKRAQQQYWFGPPYISALPPPVLRLTAPKPPQQLLESLRPLEAELAREAAKDDDADLAEGTSED